MLFKPYEPKKFGPFTFHGIIPKRRSALSKDIAKAVQKNLLTPESLSEAASSPEVSKKLTDSFDDMVEGILTRSLRKAPLINSFLNTRAVQEIKERQKEAIAKELPNLLCKISAPISNKISFESQIENQINKFELCEIEEISKEVVGRELKEVERLGALIGFIVGLLQLWLFLSL